MKNQVLTIEQMKELIQLGIDVSSASMCWLMQGSDFEDKVYMLALHDEWCYEHACLNPIPTFTQQDVLNILRDKYEGSNFSYSNTYLKLVATWLKGDDIFHKTYNGGESILQVLFDILVFCAKNDIKPKEQ